MHETARLLANYTAVYGECREANPRYIGETVFRETASRRTSFLCTSNGKEIIQNMCHETLSRFFRKRRNDSSMLCTGVPHWTWDCSIDSVFKYIMSTRMLRIFLDYYSIQIFEFYEYFLNTTVFKYSNVTNISWVPQYLFKDSNLEIFFYIILRLFHLHEFGNSSRCLFVLVFTNRGQCHGLLWVIFAILFSVELSSQSL